MPPDVKENTKSSAVNESFSFGDCARKVLEEFGDNEPMHYKEITKKALEEGWLVTLGKTPEATMYAQIISKINRQQKRGERPVFVQHGRGYVGLSRWTEDGLELQIKEQNRQVREILHKRLLDMEPCKFEKLASQLLTKMGFEMVEVTEPSKDGGIDIRGILVVGDVVRIKMAVQVKRWSKNVQTPVVQQVRGSLGTHEQGLIITTSGFSTGAEEEAAKPDKTPIALMNGEQLVMLLMENDIGVHRSTSDLFRIDEESFMEDDIK